MSLRHPLGGERQYTNAGRPLQHGPGRLRCARIIRRRMNPFRARSSMVEQGTHNPLVCRFESYRAHQDAHRQLGRCHERVSLCEPGATRIETGEWMGKSVLVGAILALVWSPSWARGAICTRVPSAESPTSVPRTVSSFFESPAEDGATVAALIAVVADGRMRETCLRTPR